MIFNSEGIYLKVEALVNDKYIGKRELEEYEEALVSDLWRWDKSDCSELGLIILWAKYLIGVENSTGYFYQDAKDLTERFESIRKKLI